MTDFADIIGTGLAPVDIGAANATHTHSEADTTNLVSDLAGKAAATHTHVESDVTSLVTDLAAKIPKSQVTAKGDLIVATASATVTNQPVGANGTLLVADSTQTAGVKWSATGIVLDATSTIGGVSGTTLAADHAAWTAYTPTLTNVTIGTGGTVTGSYLQLGKTGFVRVVLTLGTGGSFTGSVTISLPVAAATTFQPIGTALLYKSSTDTRFVGFAQSNSPATSAVFSAHGNAGTVGATNPFTWAANDQIYATFTYQTA